MVREAILQRLNEKGISQALLCERLGITKQNFSSFLCGKRSFPIQSIVETLQYLGLSVAPLSVGYATNNATHISAILARGVDRLDMSLKDFSQLCGVHRSTVCSFLNGKRNISVKNLDNILNALRYGVLPYKSKK